jgi:hypothetical protein
MEQSIKDSGKAMRGTVTAHKSGQTELSMKDIGKITKLTEEESFGTLMEMSLMVGRIITAEGEWENDKANGYGVYTHVNVAKYEG